VNICPERRFAPSEVHLSDDARPHLQGYALKFNQPSVDMGGWTEIILPDAVVLEDDVQALYDHEESKLLGRTSSGTLKLTIDDVGLFFDLDVPDTTVGRDTLELCRRGDITGCSFGFFEEEDGWVQSPTGLVRELRKVHVFEITLTPCPAYPSTEVAERSKRRWEQQQKSSWHDFKKRALRLTEKI
jgi:HK97 family phage prohead protease